MAQVKLLKIGTDGVPLEMNTASDDITLNSFTAGAGPVVSPTGVNMNTTDITALANVTFSAPSTNTINQTAGTLIIDNLMAKERSNPLTTAADILFPVVTDTSGQLDALRLPAIAGVPTATPTATGEGFMVWDSTNDDLYVWNGTAWDNQNVVKSAEAVDNIGYVAGVGGVAARDCVYISAADTVLPASGGAIATSYAIGFATSAAIAAASATVRSAGVLGGFTGLTAGARYYLSPTTAGQITTTLPTGTGQTIVGVGLAKSTTALQIRIQDLGRRA